MKKKETTDVFKAPAKIQSFEEVQKALQGITQQLNDLGVSTNSKAEGEITDKDGKTGDIRITQNKDKTYGLELKTDEGWKFPSVGESPVQLTGKKGEKARPDAVVDKFKDELGNPKNMSSPDYDSGFFHMERDRVYITGVTTGEVADGIGAPAFTSNSLYDSDNLVTLAAVTVGIKALDFDMTSPPSVTQAIMCPPGVTTWEEALATGMIRICNGYDGQHYSGWNQEGGLHWIMGPRRFAVRTPHDDYLMLQPGLTNVDNLTDNSTAWYQAHDAGGAAHTCSYRLRIWK